MSREGRAQSLGRRVRVGELPQRPIREPRIVGGFAAHERFALGRGERTRVVEEISKAVVFRWRSVRIGRRLGVVPVARREESRLGLESTSERSWVAAYWTWLAAQGAERAMRRSEGTCKSSFGPVLNPSEKSRVLSAVGACLCRSGGCRQFAGQVNNTHPMPFPSRIRSLASSLATAVVLAHLVALPAAQTQTYTGVGGRHEQSRYFIQRNVPLSTGGSVSVANASTNRRVFVRFLTSGSQEQITGFDLHMKFTGLGRVVPAWIYTANSQNEPGSEVLAGQIGIGRDMHYCRASFPTSYTVQPNTLYFIAFQLPADEELIFNTASSSGAMVTYFVGANGAAKQARLQYGVHRGGYSPAITLGQPRIGQTFSVELNGASLNREAMLWFQLPVPGSPVDLYPFGWVGSVLNLDLSNALFAGYADGEPDRTRRITFPMANDPNLVGQTLFYQWLLATNDTGIPSGWVTSNRAGCVIL